MVPFPLRGAYIVTMRTAIPTMFSPAPSVSIELRPFDQLSFLFITKAFGTYFSLQAPQPPAKRVDHI